MRAVAWFGRVVAVVAALAWFYRRQIGNRFTVLSGNPDDAVITTSLIEHWHRVFAGLDGWNRVPYFAPHTDTLGYGEGFFLLGLIAAPLRAAGIDPFVAAELATLLMRGVGGLCFAVLAQRVFRLSLPVSLLGAMLVTAAGNALVQSDHAQLATTMLLPPLGLLLAGSGRAASLRAVWRAAGWGCAAALLLGAWLLTAFYTAWFAILFLLTMAAVAIVAWRRRHGPGRRPVAAVLRPLLRPAACVAIVSILALLPFLVVYLPRAAETGLHDFRSVRAAMPTPFGLLNNRLGDGLTDRLPSPVAALIARGNVDPAGYAPGLLLLALVGIWIGVRRVGAGDGATASLWLFLGIATPVCLLLVTSVPAWHLVYWLVPGARAVRAPARFLLVLSQPLVLLAMLALDHLVPRLVPRCGRPAAGLVLAALAVLLVAEEQVSPPVAMARAPGDRLIARLAPPPEGCRSFFVTGRDPDGWHTSDDAPFYRHNADAMFVAVMTGLPTINGYSTFNPPDWDFGDVAAPDYPDRVGKYADAHALSPFLCRLDLAARRWFRNPVLPVPLVGIGQTVSLSLADPAGSRYTLAGWGGPEGDARWTSSDHASLRVLLPPEAAQTGLRFTMRASGLRHDTRHRSDWVRVEANGRLLDTVHVGSGTADYSVAIPAGTVGPDGALVITLLQPPLRTPRELGVAPDDRRLGLYVRWFRIDRA